MYTYIQRYLLCGSPGESRVNRDKVRRQYIKRVLMGPTELWNLDLLQDELSAQGLSLWGVLVEASGALQVEQFLLDMGVALANEDSKVFIGRVSAEYPDNLLRPSEWVATDFINFGDVQAGTATSHPSPVSCSVF